ncbi:transcription elongation regulator [Haplosporangium sp. Z 767]|nr:transcription elongation regulator [Haplosporangium sp. Z 767]
MNLHPAGPPQGQPMPGPIPGPPGLPGPAFGGPPPTFQPPNWLPPGWTEHKAPDGMAYFYNSTTGQSTWIRPTMGPPIPPGSIAPPPPPPGMSEYPMNQQPLHPPGVAPPSQAPPTSTGAKEGTGKSSKPKKAKKEKAVKKYAEIGSTTKSSIWIPTPELEIILAKMGQMETEKLEAERKAREEEEQERLQALKRSNEGEGAPDGEKRPRTEVDSTNTGTEMTEDDVAWQLAAMEQDMMGDQDGDQHMESQDESEDEDDESVRARLRLLQESSSTVMAPSKPAAAPMEISTENIQEREMAFLDMMRDRGVTQFDTWERAMAKIELDPRMYLIPNKKERMELFESFCVIRAKEIKEAKEREAKEKEQNDDQDRRDKERRSRDTKSTHSTSSSNKPEDVYRRLVEDYTTKTSTWLDFMTKYRIDPRFLGLKPGSLRESIFRQYLSDLKKGVIQSKARSSHSSDRDKRSSLSRPSSSRKYKATEKEIDEFMSLLKETKKDILHEHKHSSSVEWRKIKKLIDRDRRYDAVGSSTERELLFREYADRVIQRRD